MKSRKGIGQWKYMMNDVLSTQRWIIVKTFTDSVLMKERNAFGYKTTSISFHFTPAALQIL